MLQEVDPSRRSTGGSLPREIFIYWGEGRARGEGTSQTREETLIRAGLGPPRRPQARRPDADRPASPERSCDLPARTPLLVPPHPWARPARQPAPPSVPAACPPQPFPTRSLGTQKQGARGAAGWVREEMQGVHGALGPLPRHSPAPGLHLSSGAPFQPPSRPSRISLKGSSTHTCPACFLPTGNAWDKFP